LAGIGYDPYEDADKFLAFFGWWPMFCNEKGPEVTGET